MKGTTPDERRHRLITACHPGCAAARPPSTWHALAVHCEQESAIACLIREAQEEAGLHIESQEVELVHIVHHIGQEPAPHGPVLPQPYLAREPGTARA
ncbi:NUDIX domain-containing protein [Streptomyces sp. bgisy091]|uniref:NUDIX domain-containing protein n=1 Tax=Streptomyces sp. bgisy091 TaxID=3413778 RepID=UPI003D71EB90